jgi:hypothetical protein
VIRAAHRGHRERRIVREWAHHVLDRGRIDERLVALHVHHDVARQLARHLGDAIGARAMPGGRHPDVPAVTRDRSGNALVVGRHDHRVQPAGLPDALVDANDHRLAAEVGQGLAGKPGRIESGGNDGHHGGGESRAGKHVATLVGGHGGS